MYKSSFIILCIFIYSVNLVYSQKLDIKFGDISKADLEMKVYKPDPGADAVILSDVGNAELVIQGDDFKVLLVRNVRIKIINKNGLDYANVEIPYGSLDKVYKVEASTYNLVNGEIAETKVNKKSFIIDKANKYSTILRIAFPNAYEGSIIEYQYYYTTGALYSFYPWDFQSEIPVRYSEFTASWPDFFNYRGIVKGDISKIARKYETNTTFFGGYSTTKSTYKWIGMDIPSFIDEPYTTGYVDHLLKVDFELVGTNFPNRNYQELTPTYENISAKLLDREDFGGQLKNITFLEDYTRNAISGAKDELEKLDRIQRFVSNKILWNGIEDFTASKSLKKILKEERGNSADINLMLIGMLRQAGIIADPVILSTRSNGSLHPFYAMYQKFNYVLALVYINGKEYLVDATNPLQSYSTLPFECLNKQGRVIHPTQSRWVDLINKEKQSSVSLYNLSMNENGTFGGKISHSYLYYDAYNVRRFIKLESEEGYHDYIKSKYSNSEISDIKISNIDSLRRPLNITFDAQFKHGIQSTPIGYIFNPAALFDEESENLLSDEERKYPIDFGCPIQRTTTFNINIPEGFTVEELPERASLKLPNNWGSYMYSCDHRGGMLTIQSTLNITEVRFKKEDYQLLREFFAQIIKKQSEVVVIRKTI